MSGNRICLLPAAVCWLLLDCLAQAEQGGTPPAPPRAVPMAVPAAAEPAVKPTPSPAEPVATPVEQSRLPLYYLKDKDGKLVAVPGFSLEDFERAYKLLSGLAVADQRPRYALQQMSANGTAGADYAEMLFQVTILARDAEWVRVPLLLDRAVLREPAGYQGPGEHLLQFPGGGEGYVCWIRGPAGAQHNLTLKLLVPLDRVGNETRLRLLAPRATVSELKLTVPIADAIGKVSEGVTLEPSAHAADGATTFKIVGLGGNLELAWRKPGNAVAEVPAALEVVGSLFVRLDTRAVDTEASLNVRSFGTSFDRFRVMLPPGAELLPGSPVGYSVVQLDAGDAAQPERRFVEVRLEKKTVGPVEIRLAVRQPYTASKPEDWCELAGFEVREAAQQWGYIAAAVAGDRQVLWGPSRGLRQVEQVPESLRRPDVAAGFEYFAQPCSLLARLVPRQTRVEVEPEYLVLVDADQVRLDANLKYTIRGAKAASLVIELPPGWQFDDVGPDKLVAADATTVSTSNLLTIPLTQPTSGQLGLRLRAHWPIAKGNSSLVLPLPRPRADSAGAAAVIVVPADDVELVPNDTSMAGLVRQQFVSAAELPLRQQAPLLYRGDTNRAVFAADLRLQGQRIAADVFSQVRLDEQGGSVEQKLLFTVSHKPADYFVIEAPRGLAGQRRLEFQHDGKALAYTTLTDRAASQEPSGPVRLRVALPAPCIGPYELTVRYPLPRRQLTRARRTVLSIPLAMPDARELLGNRVQVLAAGGIDVAPSGGGFTVAEAPVSQGPQPVGLQLAADRRTPQIELAVQLADQDQHATVVDRAWVQTWLTPSARQDRAVFCFTSSRKELPVVLPAGTATGQVDLQLDGRPIEGRATGDGWLLVPLTGEVGQRHILEVRSHFAEHTHQPGSLSIELPRLGSDAWVRRMYWQLVLPRNEHLLAASGGLTTEFTWGWQGWFFGRRPLLEQDELEEWAGVTRRASLPMGTNQYLLSSLGNVEQGDVYTASRAWIVLMASGAALVAGLLLIYVPASRHPATLFAAAVVLLCLGLLYPEPMLLVSQAAILGLGLALLAGLLRRSLRRRRMVLPERASSVVERGSTPTNRPPAPSGSQPSTQAAAGLAAAPPDASP